MTRRIKNIWPMRQENLICVMHVWLLFGNGLIKTVVLFFLSWFICAQLNAPKSRDSLRLRRRFYRSPQKSAIFVRLQNVISFAEKIVTESRFLLQRKWIKKVFGAEFLAIPSSAVKIANERQCAILVHSSAQKRAWNGSDSLFKKQEILMFSW